MESPKDFNVESSNIEENPESQEQDLSVPESLIDFSVVDCEEVIYSVEPEKYFELAKENGIVYKIKRHTALNTDYVTDYCLKESVGEENFIFRVVKSIDGVSSSIDYKGEKYGYALMNFSLEERKKLLLIIISFINKIFNYDENVKYLKFSGAPASYTREDVDEAREVLKNLSSENDVDYEDLDPIGIRDELYSVGVEDSKIQKAENNISWKRENVFRQMLFKLFKKYGLPYEISNTELFTTDTVIKRKEV